MSRPLRVGSRIAVAVATLLTSAVAAVPAVSAPLAQLPDAAPPPAVQALPTPKAFVSNLDLECFRTPAYQPPTTFITTRHLNPLLTGLPTETHQLGARTQLCVPVAKNNSLPPPDVLPFVRFVDLACYRISGQTVNFPLTLTHLNPVLGNQPVKSTAMLTPEQLCVPVIKNNSIPPDEVLNLVRYIDLKCYGVRNTDRLGVNLGIRQLNPVLAGLAPVTVTVAEARQLCVPVRKNNQLIPNDVLNIVQWIDLEKYDTIGPALAAPFPLQLRHINPALGHLPLEQTTIQFREQLMLPVAKNGRIPPG